MYALKREYALNNGVRLTTRVYGACVFIFDVKVFAVAVKLEENSCLRKGARSMNIHVQYMYNRTATFLCVYDVACF